ncbi:hypothetical protein PVAND_005008 [Polypedilum vanderplanki]|uniref:Uncharacterized protein n=1 Tax=Polypedilum vanderplanki TaxID=319348 RepID=A0A9J6BYL0_POLVA|nr:hypothetical protein PVAND_005008 [Polypedilum vanderplanki]
MLKQKNKIIVFLSLLIIVAVTNASDICSICRCLNYESNDLLISCKNTKTKSVKIDFDNIEWPRNDDVTIKVFFNNISVNLLPKIAGDKKVTQINLDDNSIRTVEQDPFEYFQNLESISIANNRITDLPKNFLKSQTKLKQLTLSNNSLSFIDFNIITHLTELREINFSNNLFSKLSAEFLEAACNIEIMVFENNKIYAIDNAYDKIDYKLRKIYLAYNQFTVITVSMFEKLINLEYIDMSHNAIQAIDDNSFSTLTQLKLLDLSYNNLKRVVMKLPDSVELLAINNNHLITWPLLNTPVNLAELEIQDNNLEFIFPKDTELLNLKKLDVSKNNINSLPDTQFLSLEYLDLSNNFLNEVPQNLHLITPLLKDIILDGNQISKIEFTEKTTLGSISLSNLSFLEKIEAGSFSNLLGTRVTKDGSETCVNIKISNNENLIEIDENTFDGVRLCYLDLSYNQLTSIPQNLTDWEKIDYGFDLQGNPLQCICENEWMLSRLLKILYENEDFQYYLMELRCQSPEEFKNKRLVKFLDHDHPFCNLDIAKEKIQMGNIGGGFLSDISSSSASGTNFDLKPFSPGFIIIVSLCAIILVLMIIVGVKWQRDQNRKFQRRNRLYYDDYEYYN